MDLKLTFDGPYALTRRSLRPYFSVAPQASIPGIYLQVIQLEQAYRVAYAGETGATFVSRLASENTAWISGRDRRSTQVGDLDPECYREGVRRYVTPPEDDAERRKWREQILDDTLLLLCPLDVAKAVRCAVEAAIIRRLKEAPAAVADFLYNKPLRTRPFAGELEVATCDGTAVDGLSGPFRDSV